MSIETLETERYYPGDRITTRYVHLSRGRCWGRMGTGSDVTWAPKSGSAVILPSAGKWVVGSDDGFRRKDQSTYTVLPDPAAISDDQITDIRAETTAADVIEACDAALAGDAAARRSLSRVYAEAAASAAAAKRDAAKAARAAGATAEAALRTGQHSGAESVALDAEVEGRFDDATAIRSEAVL